MAMCWCAAGKQFRRVNGHLHLATLSAALDGTSPKLSEPPATMTWSAWPDDQRAATEVPRNLGHPSSISQYPVVRFPLSSRRATVRGVEISLSRLQTVPVREIWPHEAHDFTTWLLANADVLSDVIGMDLDLTAAEHKVGGFSLDLIGTDRDTGSIVIVENQLTQTDHGHLGQLLTYAGGTDPRTVVWCAPSFRDEHRAALDWLNEHTDVDTRFFGVEIAAVRIDNSAPAPMFTLIAQPNDWTKQVHTENITSLSGKGAAYQQFWSLLLHRVNTEHPDWTKSTKPTTQSWMTMPYGSSSIWYGVLFTQSGPAVELYFGSPDADVNTTEFERVRQHQAFLDNAFGETLTFEELEGRKACRIRYYRAEGGDVLDDDDRDSILDWFLSSMERFRTATQQVRTLISSAT